MIDIAELPSDVINVLDILKCSLFKRRNRKILYLIVDKYNNITNISIYIHIYIYYIVIGGGG